MSVVTSLRKRISPPVTSFVSADTLAKEVLSLQKGRENTMQHSFDIGIAMQYGVYAAILLNNLGYWIKHNEANGTNFHDGKYWTYNSRKAYKELFPYMSERQINTALEKLISDGLVVTGNYNESAYDRTLWYALTQNGKSILHFFKMEND